MGWLLTLDISGRGHVRGGRTSFAKSCPGSCPGCVANALIAPINPGHRPAIHVLPISGVPRTFPVGQWRSHALRVSGAKLATSGRQSHPRVAAVGRDRDSQNARRAHASGIVGPVRARTFLYPTTQEGHWPMSRLCRSGMRESPSESGCLTPSIRWTRPRSPEHPALALLHPLCASRGGANLEPIHPPSTTGSKICVREMPATTPHRQSISALLDAASADAATFRCNAAAPPWAVTEVPTPQPERRVLSLADAAEVVPLSQKTLYRVAQSGRGPFRKVEGRWMVYDDDLHEWVRSHPTGQASGASPLARKRPRRRGSGMRARVLEAAG